MSNKIEYESGGMSFQGHKIESGVCPNCGGGDLNYGVLTPDHEEIYYAWTCSDCNTRGEEYLRVEFTKHLIKIEDDTTVKALLTNLFQDFQMLKHETWIPDAKSCDASIETVREIAKKLNIEIKE